VQEKEDRFEQSWRAYPRKVAKQVAMKAFEKIDPDEALLETMITAIGKWKTTDQWIKDTRQWYEMGQYGTGWDKGLCDMISSSKEG